jgi:hypothetical protein
MTTLMPMSGDTDNNGKLEHWWEKPSNKEWTGSKHVERADLSPFCLVAKVSSTIST